MSTNLIPICRTINGFNALYVYVCIPLGIPTYPYIHFYNVYLSPPMVDFVHGSLITADCKGDSAPKQRPPFDMQRYESLKAQGLTARHCPGNGDAGSHLCGML